MTIVIVILAALAVFPILFAKTASKRLNETAPGEARTRAERRFARNVSATFAVLFCVAFIAALLFSTLSVVPTQRVGIPVTFGKMGDPVSAGLHFKAPWTKMERMDATIQSLDASGDNPTTAKDVDKADVFVHNNVRWSIKEESATSLYRDYREFSNINDSLVQPAVRESIAAVMQDFDPLGTDNPSNTEIASKVKETLQKRVGDRVTIHEVTITLIDFAEPTKNRINALNTERGNSRIANQRKETASANAEANRILSESVANDPNVLIANCLEMVQEKGDVLPAGFQCFPNAGNDLIVDGTAPKDR